MKNLLIDRIVQAVNKNFTEFDKVTEQMPNLQVLREIMEKNDVIEKYEEKM